MSDVDLSNFLPILTIGLWVGVSITIISKLLSFVIGTVISWFKRLL